MRNIHAFLAIILLSVHLLSCVSPSPDGLIEPTTPELTTENIVQRIPAHVPDRVGWADDIAFAIRAIDRELTAERVCAVIAVIEQESGYQTDPVVPNLPQIVREGLRKKFAKLGPLAEPALNTLLSGKAPGSSQTFHQRINKLRTERDLDRFFRDMANAYRERMPGPYAIASGLSLILGKGSLQNLNPVTTAGSMQVKISYARDLEDLKSMTDEQLREYLYTRMGGIRVGTARLIDYPASYDDLIYRFADFNVGMYASRNAAFQAMLSDLTGRKLALDGDLLVYDEDGEPKDIDSESLKAMLAFGEKHDVSAWTIRRDARKEKSADFEDTETWEKVREVWEAKKRRKPPYARVPDVELVSPKLARNRSTSWFANRVKQRYQSCRARG
ncbi:DUF1615 family protein [Oligoflexus tunisiensis]|uniref:DUF1615 family protein n=1 Tax=Oligoflexus tunisiensis TaxID=708132 RepID=UPI00159EF589|nr:DUF1615 family protein [Oligoflexus tunisiensis]